MPGKVKTVYPSDMVCHLWANDHAHETRTATGNVFTRNYGSASAIYSYGTHFAMAARMETPSGARVLLLNAASYSNTTSKHQYQLRRALSADQYIAAIYVPALEYEHVTSGARGLCMLADACVKAAIDPLEKADKARQRFAGYVQTAARKLDTARQLFTLANEKKRAASVPALSKDASKADAARTLAAIARESLLDSARRFETDARAAFVRATEYADANKAGIESHYYTARRVCETGVHAVRKYESAAHDYKRANAKAPVKNARDIKAARALVAEFTPLAIAEQHAEQADAFRAGVRAMITTLANRKRKNSFPLSGNKRVPLGGMYALNRAYDAISGFNDASSHDIFPNFKERAAIMPQAVSIRKRAARIIALDSLESSIYSLDSACDQYESRGDHGYSVPDSRHVVGMLRKVDAVCGGVPDYWCERANAIIRKADTLAASHAERVRALNAEKIERWRAGEYAIVPRDMPPMIRVKNGEVQTSWGASVPLAHAARLVKIARRVSRSGGADYADGSGPIVGAFRVNRIGADMAAIIGCHHIDASEAERASVLIMAACEACETCREAISEACQGVTA